jgi:hypothetical protein
MTLTSIFIAILNLLIARYYMPSSHQRVFIIANLVYWSIFLIPLILLTFSAPIVCYAICWFFFLISFILSGRRNEAQAG